MRNFGAMADPGTLTQIDLVALARVANSLAVRAPTRRSLAKRPGHWIVNARDLSKNYSILLSERDFKKQTNWHHPSGCTKRHGHQQKNSAHTRDLGIAPALLFQRGITPHTLEPTRPWPCFLPAKWTLGYPSPNQLCDL